MGRLKRVDVGGHVYHVLNRGNGRMTIFEDEDDYAAFERVLEEAAERHPGVGVLAYCMMPNHWHLVLKTSSNGDLASFVGWLTLTHTQRWHAHRRNEGGGHVYQGRFKSFLVDTEGYLAHVCRYVERNPLRAGLVKKAEAWQWSSLHRWHKGSAEAKRLLKPWPVPSGKRPPNWIKRVNAPETQAELEALQTATNRGQPYGGEKWRKRVVRRFGLESTFRPRGRPRKDNSK